MMKEPPKVASYEGMSESLKVDGQWYLILHYDIAA
jgi:hypothetical protein